MRDGKPSDKIGDAVAKLNDNILVIKHDLSVGPNSSKRFHQISLANVTDILFLDGLESFCRQNVFIPLAQG